MRRGISGIVARGLLAGCLALLVSMPSFALLRIGIQYPVDPADYRPGERERVAESLGRQLPEEQVELILLDAEGIAKAVEAGEVDVAVADPGLFEYLSRRVGLDPPVASVLRHYRGQPVRSMGGVVLVRGDREDLLGLGDLRGQRIAHGSRFSVGGYQAQAVAALGAGVDITRDAKTVEIPGGVGGLLEALRAGTADAVFLRSGVFEALAGNGRIGPGEFRVLAPRSAPDFPLAVSTPIYPEYVVFMMPSLARERAARVAGAILSMGFNPANGERAQVTGIDLPQDLHPVRELARTLRLPPYDVRASVDLLALAKEHLAVVLVMLALAAALVVIALALAVNQRRLRQVSAALAEKAEREAEGRRELRTLLDTLPDLVWVKDPEGHYTACNRAFWEFANLREDQIIGETMRVLLDGGTAKVFSAEDEEALGTSLPVRAQHWMPRRTDGKLLLLDTERVAIRDPEGNPTGVLGIARDITESYLARQELDQRLRQLSCLYDVLQLTSDPDASVSTVLQSVASRAPSGLRADPRARVSVVVGSTRFGPDLAGDAGVVATRFDAGDGVTGRLLLAREVVKEQDRELLVGERELLDAVARRVEVFLTRSASERQRR
ncbi:MAG: PhnD/SsuA/transferrin family substrate-binding protein, partial [Gammaproteobacteria bacterium]